MLRKRMLGILVCAVGLAVAGCQQPKMTRAEFEAMFKPPERPDSYKVLDSLVGTWEYSGDATANGVDEPLKGSGRQVFTWEADNWVLLVREEGQMGETCKMKGVGTWIWDFNKKKFRVSWIGTGGMMAEGWSWYDEKTKTLHLEVTDEMPKLGKSKGSGTMHIVDNNTIEMHWTETDTWGLTKYMESHGTAKRVK